MPKAKITVKPPVEEEPKPTTQKYLRLRNLELVHWVIVFLVLALVGAFTAFGLYLRSSKQLAEAKKQIAAYSSPSAQAQEEVRQILSKVGQLVVLPSDETPTVATVNDLEKLKDQPFFAQAQIGDKVLIFSTAKKAILYRPSTNKVIEIAPFNLDSSAAPANQASAPVTVTVLNGSGITGAGKRVSEKLKAASFNVVKVGDAADTATTIVKYKEGYEAQASSLNQSLGGQANLQQDNSLSTTLVVTLGKNYTP